MLNINQLRVDNKVKIVRYTYEDGNIKKNIGSYYPEDNTFRKSISFKKHLFRKANAIGFQAELIDDLELRKCIGLIVNNKDKQGETYYIPLKILKEKGFYLTLKEGAQLFLRLDDFWTKETIVSLDRSKELAERL